MGYLCSNRSGAVHVSSAKGLQSADRLVEGFGTGDMH